MLFLASSKNYRRQQVNRGGDVADAEALGCVQINFGHYFSFFLKAELLSDQCEKCVSLKISTPTSSSYNKYGTRKKI